MQNTQQNNTKKEWIPNLKVKDAIDVCISWSIRARQKNVLAQKSPELFHAYVLNDTPNISYFQGVSSVFKYSQKDTPYTDSARDMFLRLLSVCLKAHFFLYHNYTVAYEPHFFIMPNLADPTQTEYGLVYKVAHENKCIVVSSKDLKSLYNNDGKEAKILFHFPAIVPEDNMKWFHYKKWYKLRDLANFDDKIEKTWQTKKEIEEAKNVKTAEELTKFGTILDVPLDIKDYIKPTGIIWHSHLQTWYLPLGFDVENVREYIAFIKKNKLPLSNKENGKDSSFYKKNYYSKKVEEKTIDSIKNASDTSDTSIN